MKNLCLLAVFAFSKISFCDSQTLFTNYLLVADKDILSIPFSNYNGALLNDICTEKIQSCHAYRVFLAKPKDLKKIELYIDNLPHAASAYCKYHGGAPLSLSKNENQRKSFCAFSDKTVISSWDLYYSHFESPQNKDFNK
ncbi:MAG: DUF333 domain-containing protein [Bacteriovoracaceae bacterium]